MSAIIAFHNTLAGKKEIFTPLADGRVKMYVCGITPYDQSHLGHARCYVFFDTVRRHFQNRGFQVTYVQNFTDVDDKIIARAAQLKLSPLELADKYINDYFHKMALLNVAPADHYPRVTAVIPETVRFIERLVKKGLAYVLDGDVYYSVRQFKNYGNLSKRPLDEMESGARVEVNERKKDPLDFALWKAAKPNEPSWDSPWGKGRPGWHIECSVMSMKFLDETFDLHGGGQDLIFPHHENEIAQSEGLTGKPFARYWLHNGFVTVNREKMSKSLGNFFTLGEIFEKFSPEVVRLFLLSRHYKSPLDFSDDLLEQAQNAHRALSDTAVSLNYMLEGHPASDARLEDYEKEFLGALDDDFNTEKAIGVVFKLKNEIAEKVAKGNFVWLARARATMEFFCEKSLGVALKSALDPALTAKVREKLNSRDAMRKNKDWKGSDLLRAEVEALGYDVEDTPAGALIKPRHAKG